MAKVGYGSPPQDKRWQKARSGNPSGRPKKRANFADDMIAELDEVIQITEGGKVKRPSLSPEMKPLNLSTQEKQDLIAFLQALKGEPLDIRIPKLP